MHIVQTDARDQLQERLTSAYEGVSLAPSSICTCVAVQSFVKGENR